MVLTGQGSSEGNGGTELVSGHPSRASGAGGRAAPWRVTDV